MTDPADSAVRALMEEYSAKSLEYAKHWGPVIAPMSRPLLAELPLTAARCVLDAGAGTGSLLPDLRSAAPQAPVLGADISLGMLRIAQKKGLSPLAVMSIDRLALRPVFDVAVLAF